MNLNILTFNSHQTFVYNFAKIGARIYVIHEIHGKKINKWNTNVRPCPENVTLISLGEAKRLYRRKKIDLAVCHNISDIMEIKDLRAKKILCVHGTVKGRIATERSGIKEGEWNRTVRSYLSTIRDLHMVHVSKKKANGRELDGRIIPLGVDPDEYYGYRGSMPKALTVANRFIMRRNILGYDIHRAIIRLLPGEIVGENPGLPDSKPAKTWDELREKYRAHRLYLFTALGEYEDGYNTAMLEAMATGMPVISYLNDSSPIIDGINGYISDDISYLRKRVCHLLENREAAVQLGKAARQTAVQRFGIRQFVEKWRQLIAEIV